MKKYIVVLLLGTILILACKSQKKLIPKNDLVNILVDINLANSMGNDYLTKRKFPELDSAVLYRSIFDKYGYSKELFDTTMAYYTRHPDAFDKVYDRVIANLTKMEDEVSNKSPEKK